jgi:Pvc16 N-terminal domain
MDLIRTVLDLIRQKLNESFANLDPRPDDWVVLANVVDHDGRPNAAAKDKIVMVLANIKHETVVSTYTSTVGTKSSSYGIVTPPLYIDLYILFYANFYDENYRQGLAMISRTISFFQQNPWFTPDNLPDLPPAVEKLTMEITSLDLLEVNYLMGMLGVKYLPSVFYKLRMLPFVGDAIAGVTPPVGGGDTTERAPT